jgi:hypothetical protein
MILAYALEFACICWVGFNPENPGLVLHCVEAFGAST